MDPSPKGWNRPRVVREVPADRTVWFVSDLHLGDGTPSDAFFGKDALLVALLERAEAEGAVVVVNGDAIDFPQAWGFMRVMRAHPKVLSTMSRLSRAGQLYYVIGNHDYDLALLRDVLDLQVADELHLGTEVLVRHGYEYDPYITEMLEAGQWHTYAHHLVERALGTWLRLPLGEFYTLPNRILFWLGHKVALVARAFQVLGRRLGVDTPVSDELLANLDFWIWGNQGDSMGIFRPAMQDLANGPWRALVCGHSHVPGVVRHGDKIYANSGSWTFGAAQYAVWDGHDLTVHDWITGRRYEDELYKALTDPPIWERGFMSWWSTSYLGWLRFAEGERRRGELRGWELQTRENQHLGELRALPEPPHLSRRARPTPPEEP